MDEQVPMRMVALIEALVVLLASVTACGPLATGPSGGLRTPGASTDRPTSSWDHAPDHPSLLEYQIARKESCSSEQGAKPAKIMAAETALGVKARPFCRRFAESSAGIVAVVPQPSLLSLCCLLIV
jgi:hypothetical protein